MSSTNILKKDKKQLDMNQIERKLSVFQERINSYLKSFEKYEGEIEGFKKFKEELNNLIENSDILKISVDKQNNFISGLNTELENFKLKNIQCVEGIKKNKNEIGKFNDIIQDLESKIRKELELSQSDLENRLDLKINVKKPEITEYQVKQLIETELSSVFFYIDKFKKDFENLQNNINVELSPIKKLLETTLNDVSNNKTDIDKMKKTLSMFEEEIVKTIFKVEGNIVETIHKEKKDIENTIPDMDTIRKEIQEKLENISMDRNNCLLKTNNLEKKLSIFQRRLEGLGLIVEGKKLDNQV